jgi:hypothetical protein
MACNAFTKKIVVYLKFKFNGYLVCFLGNPRPGNPSPHYTEGEVRSRS